MKTKYSKKDNIEKLKGYKKRFLKQKQFPAFPNPYDNKMEPILHTAYLIFIRSKFLLIGLMDSLEDRNLYAAYTLLKAYWENVAAFDYYYIRISSLLEEGNMDEAFKLSRKMGLGGRGFLTKEMAEKDGNTLDDYFIPSISKMLDTVDKDFQRITGEKYGIMRELYDSEIAEGGHTTYLGLSICGRWILPEKALLPDVKKSWQKNSHGSILNNASLASTLFFFYWGKFEEKFVT